MSYAEAAPLLGTLVHWAYAKEADENNNIPAPMLNIDLVNGFIINFPIDLTRTIDYG